MKMLSFKNSFRVNINFYNIIINYHKITTYSLDSRTKRIEEKITGISSQTGKKAPGHRIL